MDDTESFS